MRQFLYHLRGLPMVVLLAFVFAAVIVAPVLELGPQAQADTVVIQEGGTAANIGGLGTAVGTGKIIVPKCLCETGSTASTWKIRQYATVDTGTELYRIRCPANTAPTPIDLDELVKGFGTTGASAEQANKASGGLKVSQGGMRIQPVTASTDSILICTYR